MRLPFAKLILAMAATSVSANELDLGRSDTALLYQPQSLAFSDGVGFHAGLGVAFLEGNEYVFSGSGTLSQLIWQSTAPVFRAGVDAGLGSGFSVSASGSLAGFGDSYMEDYDWRIETDRFDEWTDRSQHSATDLDHYFAGELALAYDVFTTMDSIVRLQAGVKYTDVQWSAYGGSFVYSTPRPPGGPITGFRDDIFSLPDSAPAATYRQQLPEIFLGVAGERSFGNLRLGGLVRGGVTLFASSHDNHWQRNLNIDDRFKPAPTISIGGDASYALGPAADLFLDARYDHAFLMQGDATYNDAGTVTTFGNAGGADLSSLTLTTGLKGQF